LPRKLCAISLPRPALENFSPLIGFYHEKDPEDESDKA